MNGGRSLGEFGGLLAPLVLINTLTKAAEKWVSRKVAKHASDAIVFQIERIRADREGLLICYRRLLE